MTRLPHGYDAWRLRGPLDEYESELGESEGQDCNRWIEPDEDYPKPRKCSGEMVSECGSVFCDTCGECAE